MAATHVLVNGGDVLRSMSRQDNKSVRETNAQTDLARAQGKREFWEGFWRSAAVIVPSGFKYLCIGWGASKSADVLVSWGGKSTDADVRLNVITDLFSRQATGLGLPWILVLVLFVLLMRERKIKEREIAKLGEMTRKYEELSDSKRTSSQLLPSGKAQPRDLP